MRPTDNIKNLFRSILWLFLGITLPSCVADEECYEYREEVKLPLHIDWGEITDKPEHLKFIFFSTENDWIFVRYPETNEDTLLVPYGNYRVLFYNWRSNGDTQYIQFEEEDSYYTAQAGTGFKKSMLFTEEVLMQPDYFFSWSSGENIVPVFNEKEQAGTRAGQALTVTPVQAVDFYDFFIPATGTQYVKRAEAVLSGSARYELLHNRQPTGKAYLTAVDMYPQTDGIRFRFSVFGFLPGVNNRLTVRFILLDNSTWEITYDLSRELPTGEIKGPFNPIHIPVIEGESSFEDPDIGEWQEIFEDIPF